MAEGARLEIVLPLIAVPGFKSPSLRHIGAKFDFAPIYFLVTDGICSRFEGLY